MKYSLEEFLKETLQIFQNKNPGGIRDEISASLGESRIPGGISEINSDRILESRNQIVSEKIRKNAGEQLKETWRHF